jgi:hypothetical protein
MALAMAGVTIDSQVEFVHGTMFIEARHSEILTYSSFSLWYHTQPRY